MIMGHVITNCPIIPDPQLNWQEMPAAFDRAVSDAMKMIRGTGITTKVDVGLKTFTGEQQCWLALYERESQFRGVPQFWINEATPGIMDAAVLPQKVTVEEVMIDSIVHEFGHIIEESSIQSSDLYDLIYGPFSDEEDFAEYFIDYLRYEDWNQRRDVMDKVIKAYVKDVF
jgi:hypothetical protein